MISIPASLQTKLESGATTLCWCWRMTRKDGTTFGFTDHDKPLQFDGLTYEAGSGWSPGAGRVETGLSPARASAFGAIDSSVITPEDLDNGLWDAALVEIYRVDWSDPDDRYRALTGEISDISRTDTGFEAEIAGLSARLNRRIGRVFSRACDAELGDARCGVDLSDPTLTVSVSVTQVIEKDLVAVSGAEGVGAGWFTHGVAQFTSGANHNTRIRVTSHSVTNGETLIRMERPPAVAITVSDMLDLVAGCNKQAAICTAKFSNIANFRGFPHMPGNDVLIRHAASETRRDGSAR